MDGKGEERDRKEGEDDEVREKITKEKEEKRIGEWKKEKEK